MNLFSKFFQKVFRKSINVVEWIVHTPETIIWNFSQGRGDIQNGAHLKVRKNQVAVLVNEGQFADMYLPGDYELTTNNMPILTTLKGWEHGFDSPFKVDIYFIKTKEFMHVAWETENDVAMYDPKFGPIHINSLGTFSFRVEDDPIVFIRNVVGTDGNFTTDNISEKLHKFVIEKFTEYINESDIAVLDIARDLQEFSNEFTIAMKKDFSKYGIKLTKFRVESISLPEVVKAALDNETSKHSIGNLTSYTQMQFTDMLNNAGTNFIN